jgi:hypothetical protein
VTQILLDLFVYRKIPQEFWMKRLDLNYDELNKVLTVLSKEFGGKLSKDELYIPSLIDGFERGLNIDKMAEDLHIDPLELLKRVEFIGSLLNLRIIAGDTINPFLVKGVQSFEIFCQVDTSNYEEPSLYFECQNCRRIMCKNCRKIESTHECPFCGNIAAFIVDLPRYCPSCSVTYTYSYNLETTETCHFCNTGPLKAGWKPVFEQIIKLDKFETDLMGFIENYKDVKINLSELVTYIQRPSAEVIKMLEKLIVHQKIHASINIKEMQLQILDGLKTKNICELCSNRLSDKKLYVCESCTASICMQCYQELGSVGMTTCPECGQVLEYKE